MSRHALLLLVACLVVAPACNQPLASVAPNEVTRIVIAHPHGGVTITNPAQVSKLVSVMRKAKADSTAYDTAKTLSLAFYRGEKLLLRCPAGDSLFNAGEQQYYSKEFQHIVQEILAKEKTNTRKPLVSSE